MSINLYIHSCPSFALTVFFFFNDTATTDIYTLSLHDALPIFARALPFVLLAPAVTAQFFVDPEISEVLVRPSPNGQDRKSTRLNSSHSQISYAVFCLKKKKKNYIKIDSRFREHEKIYVVIIVC